MLTHAFALTLTATGLVKQRERPGFALIVSDAQNKYVDNEETRAAIEEINRLAPLCEEAGAYAYWVYFHGYRKHGIDAEGGYAANYRQDERNFVWGKNGYSPFLQSRLLGGSKLDLHMRARDIGTVFHVGINFSTCVFWAARDSWKLGYKTYVILGASANNNANQPMRTETLERYRREMPEIELITPDEALALMNKLSSRFQHDIAPKLLEIK